MLNTDLTQIQKYYETLVTLRGVLHRRGSVKERNQELEYGLYTLYTRIT
jgi:hypothetical protein